MIDDDQEDPGVEPGTIGVGMGGSCPTCRAPVDLGQEFCLECGAPIRFTPRQRQRRGARPAPGAGAPAVERRAKRGSGFPWVPFAIVLVLVLGGAGLALVDGGDKGGSGTAGDSTEPALPTITSEPPTTEDSTTLTTTLEDCDPTRPLDGTEPAIEDTADDAADATIDPNTGEQIPELDDGLGDASDLGGFDDTSDVGVDDGTDVPSTEADESGAATVTVDQDGNLCPSTDESTTPGATDTTTTETTDTDATSTSGTWPTGRDGWTVIVAGYNTGSNPQAQAQQRAADLQEDGFSDSGVLFSTDFNSLCPGIHVVYSGVFDSEAKASQREDELIDKGYAGMYVREVRVGGAEADCQTVQS